MSRPAGVQVDVEPLQQYEYELIMARLPAHWQLFYNLLWQTGARVGEALQLVKADIADGGVFITSEKRADHLRAFIPLTPDLFYGIRNYMNSKKGLIVFPFTRAGASKALKVACAAAGIRTTIHPHSFRHGFGYRAMKADLGTSSALDHLRTVQKMMRHTRISSTEVYTNATKEDVRDAFKKINK
jgi:integrase